MTRTFKRLTVREREIIARYYYRGYNQSKIAKLLGVHRSTISRELKRDQFYPYGYIHLVAQDKNDERRKQDYKKKITKNTFLQDYIEEELKLGWSPQLIVSRCQLLFGKGYISHETIYAYLFSP
jgi:transposase, IS30 family